MTLLSFDLIHQKAKELGWDDVGITAATLPKEDVSFFKNWLNEKKEGSLEYMKNPLRLSLEEFFPQAKTALIFVTYYKQPKVSFQKGGGVVASYARGKDYHHLHRKRLKKFILWMEEITKKKGIAKGFSDSSPVLEKALAVQAGLGWFGKNTLFIHRKFGTFTLLSGLLTTLPIEGKQEPTRVPRCGSCQKCLDACPTKALSPYKLEPTQCLSYHLIESKNPIPSSILKSNPGYAFGCDICQDVCPHNVKTPLSSEENFSPTQGVGSFLTLLDLQEIEKQPERLFGTPLQRRKPLGLKYNLETLNLS